MNWQDYWQLCKPRVVMLMILTVWVGMGLAPAPLTLFWPHVWFGTLGIACCAAAGAAINHLVEVQIDRRMQRTKARPLAAGRLNVQQGGWFAAILMSVGLIILYILVNPLTAWLTFFSLIGYAFLYTLFLKPATPQNIVIGGIAGATPPLLGWTAISNQVDPMGLLLVLIIFIWTPPHFWALAIHRYDDYQKSQLPMLPITHGIAFTKLAILLYTILLILATLLPFAIGQMGFIYLINVTILNSIFLYYAIRLYQTEQPQIALTTFKYSIVYLMLLFLTLLLDRYW